GDVTEQGRVAELRHVNAGMPSGKIGREEESSECDKGRQLSPGPMNRLAYGGGDDEKEGQRQAQSPESGGHRSHTSQAHQPRSKRKHAAANQQGRERIRMVLTSHQTRLGISWVERKGN